MKNKGITLVALVVTIVIMLILAGVSIRLIIGDDGLIGRTKQAVDAYQIESERETIGLSVTSYNLDEHLEGDGTKLGKKLVDRNLENSSIWDIIVEKSENKEYGTGWNYIEKGTNIEGYGEAKNNWVVNYETGEIIKLEDDTYNNFNYKSSIAVEGPIYNLDSANVGLDKKSWGNNATLYYYDDKEYNTIEKRQNAYNNQKGETVETFGGYDRQKSENISDYLDESTGAFKFNGNNYIEIKSDGEFDFSKGLSIEFYGKILGNVQSVIKNESFTGLFAFWSGNHNDACSVRVGIHFEGRHIQYNLGNGGQTGTQCGEWSDVTYPWNQCVLVGDNLFNNDIYFVLSFNPNEIENDKNITQKLYINDGSEITNNLKKKSGWLSKEYYDEFVENVKKFNYLELGRCQMTESGNWSYLKGLCYSIRIYNKELTNEEIEANYKKTTEFHKYIIDSKK